MEKLNVELNRQNSNITRIKTIFIFFNLIIILLFWILTLNFYRHKKNDAISNSHRRTDIITKAVDMHLNQAFETMVIVLDNMRHSVQSHPNTLIQKSFYNGFLSENNDLIHALLISNNKGEIIESTNPELLKINIRDKAYFKYHSKNSSDKIYLDKAITENHSKIVLIPFSMRLSDKNGFFNGVAIVYVYPEYFTNYFKSINLGRISIQSDRGFVLVGIKDTDQPLVNTTLISNRVATKLRDSLYFSEIGKSDIDGALRIRTVKRFRNSQFYIVCSESLMKINKEIFDATFPLVLSTILISIFVLVFIFLFLRTLAKQNILEKALFESEETSRMLVNTITESIVVIKNDLTVFYNPMFYRIIGYTKEDILTRSFFSFVQEEDKKSLETVINKVKQNLKPHNHLVIKLLSKDEETIWVNCYTSYLYWKGEPAILLTLIDITDQIKNREREKQQISRLELFNQQLEKEIRENHELQIKNEQIISQLADKTKELENFTYTVSHDLRSPLLTIKGFSAFLKKDLKKNDNENVFSDLEKIEFATVKMSDLIDDLLKLSRTGRLSVKFKDNSVTDIINEVTRLIQYSIINKKAEIIIDNEMPSIYGDREGIKEIYQNLIDNAIKYSQINTNPEIHIGYDKIKSVYYVKDNGIGIQKDFIDKAFGLFTKYDQNTVGTGVGLAIVKRIIEAHNGQIWVETNNNSGTSFFFYFDKEKMSD